MMERRNSIGLTVCALMLAAATAARADFAGQTILGPLGPGSSVLGDTTGANDDNDGFSSGGHFFFIWNGPDDAWQLDWPGGDLALEMTYDNTFIDLDLFLYEPGSYDDSFNMGIFNTGVENISVPGAVAGTYYVLVDGVASSDFGPYTLNITPEPGSLALLGMGLVLALRRTRKSH